MLINVNVWRWPADSYCSVFVHCLCGQRGFIIYYLSQVHNILEQIIQMKWHIWRAQANKSSANYSCQRNWSNYVIYNVVKLIFKYPAFCIALASTLFQARAYQYFLFCIRMRTHLEDTHVNTICSNIIHQSNMHIMSIYVVYGEKKKTNMDAVFDEKLYISIIWLNKCFVWFGLLR